MATDLFYQKDGVFHVDFSKFTSDDDYYDEDDSVDLVSIYDAISNEMADGQVCLAYDDESTEETCAYLFYKKGENFFVDYLYLEEEGVFRFKNDHLYWFTDYRRHMTLIEETDFLNALSDYIKNSNVPLEASLSVLQGRLVANPTVLSPLAPEKAEKVKTIAGLIKSSGPLVALVSALSVFLFMNTLASALLGFGIGFLAYNLYLTIAIVLKLRHAYCVVQLFANHLPTPEEVNWKLYPSIEKYFKPIKNIGLSIILIVIGLFV